MENELPITNGRAMPNSFHAGLLRAALLAVIAAASASLGGCASGANSTFQPDSVDFGGNGLSHGHPG